MVWRNIVENPTMANSTNPKLASDVLVSVATIPFLLVLLGSRVAAKAFQEMGQMSEEVFRGDRLPILRMSAMQQFDRNG